MSEQLLDPRALVEMNGMHLCEDGEILDTKNIPFFFFGVECDIYDLSELK